MNRRFVLLLAVVAALPAWLRAAETRGPIASSIDGAVNAVLEPKQRGPARPNLCGGCGALDTEQDRDEPPFVKGWLAGGVGAAVGFSAGLAFGRDAGSENASTALLGGWQLGDSIVAGTTAAAWLATRVFDRSPEGPAGGRWSDCDQGRDSLNRLDRHLADALGSGRRRRDAAAISDLTALAALSLPYGLVAGARPDQGGRDLAVATGALVVNAALHDVATRLFDRPRPYAHFCRPLEPHGLCDKHARSSFYSGHTSTAFTMAVTAGMLSHYHGYSNEAWVWATGLTLATTAGVLRIAADEHYLTDVVAGAAAGALVGFVIPRIHRPPATNAPTGASSARPPAVVSLPLRLGGLEGQGAVRAGVGAGVFLEASWHW